MAYKGLSQHINFDKLPAPENRFKLQHLIGEGTYGEVYSAKDTKTGASVAIKVSLIFFCVNFSLRLWSTIFLTLSK